MGLEIAAVHYPSWTSRNSCTAHLIKPPASAMASGTSIIDTSHRPIIFCFQREMLVVPNFLATPEKAGLGFIHLSMTRSEKRSLDLLLNAYQLQNLGSLKRNRLSEALAQFRTTCVRQAGIRGHERHAGCGIA